MKKELLVAMLLFCVSLNAEVVVLKNGTQARGEILVQNEEVIIVRDASGARYQYPRAEVLRIVEEQETVAEAVQEVKTVGEGHKKKVSILLETGVGATMLPGDGRAGVGYLVDLMVGSHNLADRRIFVGAGLGYHGDMLGGAYNFLPIQAALRMPLVVSKHAPIVGLSIGHSLGLHKDYIGGLCTEFLFGYRYEVNSKTSLAVSADLRFQQAKMSVETKPEESVPTDIYINKTGRNIVRAGLKFSLFF